MEDYCYQAFSVAPNPMNCADKERERLCFWVLSSKEVESLKYLPTCCCVQHVGRSKFHQVFNGRFLMVKVY